MMRGAYRLLTVRGIPIRLHWSFLAFMLFAVAYNTATGGVEEAVWWAAITCLVFAFVVMHELSHAIVAQRYRLTVREIVLLPIGGVAQLERIPEEPGQEAAIAIAGPAFNFVVAGLLFGFMWWLPGIDFDPLDLANNPTVFTKGMVVLFQVNAMLALFNLVPAFPMDGGRLLRAGLVASGMTHPRATSATVRVSKVLLVVFAILGLWKAPMLLLIALVLYVGATGEEAVVRMRTALRALTAGHLLPQHPVGVEPETTLGELLPLLLSSDQRDFPVVKRGRLLGVVCHADLVRGLKAPGGPDTPAERVMRPPFEAAADENLAALQLRMEARQAPVACILERGRLAGLVSRDGLRRLAAVLDGDAGL